MTELLPNTRSYLTYRKNGIVNHGKQVRVIITEVAGSYQRLYLSLISLIDVLIVALAHDNNILWWSCKVLIISCWQYE